jgi:hypothetical protein
MALAVSPVSSLIINWREQRHHHFGSPRRFSRIRKTLAESDCVAEEAVQCEPVCKAEFPANREIYREFLTFRTRLYDSEVNSTAKPMAY